MIDETVFSDFILVAEKDVQFKQEDFNTFKADSFKRNAVLKAMVDKLGKLDSFDVGTQPVQAQDLQEPQSRQTEGLMAAMQNNLN